MHEDTGNIFSKLPSLMLWQFDISLLNVCEGVTCIHVLCSTYKSKILPNPSVLCRVHQLLSGISSVSLLNKPVLPFFFFVFVLFLFCFLTLVTVVQELIKSALLKQMFIILQCQVINFSIVITFYVVQNSCTLWSRVAQVALQDACFSRTVSAHAVSGKPISQLHQYFSIGRA